MVRVLLVSVVVMVGASVAACSDASGQDVAGQGSPDEGPADAPLPAAITCGTQYRPDAESLDGAEEPELTVERPSPGDPPSVGTVSFPTMTLTVSFDGESPEGRNVAVEVTSDAGEQLLRVLYQVGGMPLADIEFVGGHGFTGLHYVGHDAAQLQFWCSANPT